jgi:ArsR family transcriptional regulator
MGAPFSERSRIERCRIDDDRYIVLVSTVVNVTSGGAEVLMDVKEITSCCGSVLSAPLGEAEAEELAAAFKVVADPVRLRLLSLVASHDGGEACVCDLNEAFDLSQPTISHHLKLLHDAGLLDREKRGVWVYYRVSTSALGR